MNYEEVVSALQVLGAIPRNSEDSNFQSLIPTMFAYAEGRIYRDLSFLATDATEVITLVPPTTDHELPDNVLSVRSVAILTPSGPPASNSRRHYPERVSPEALDMFWPQGSLKRGIPKMYSIKATRRAADSAPNPNPPTTQPLPPLHIPERFLLVLNLMPALDRFYTCEIYGSIQPQPLSEINPETYVTRYYSELFIACCMVFITGYQRDYGASADDPQRAMSWEGQYQALKNGIALEVGRQRGEGPGFTALPPAPIAQQPRSP